MANTAPPTGAVTFLFTDIEGSTALWESYPTQMEADLARHDDILCQIIEDHGGHVFKMVGDACCAAFAYPREALRAALEAQRTLFSEEWSEPVSLRVRMALHTGATEERDGDYFGPPVNRVARLLAVGHGGQVLLSGATHNLVRDHPQLVDKEARLVDLGEHRLKDLRHPEQVFQLAIPDLPDKFPPLRADKRPDDFDNRFRFKDFLGSGGMAKVYLAHDERLDREVAIKVLHPRYVEDEEFVERFKREARSAAKLSHANIVPIYDRGEKKDGTYYMVMEYLPGGALKDRIVRDRTLSAHTAVGLTLQIARALQAAHQEGIVHRDIKPQNVLMTRSGDVKVADFGIAKAASASTLTRTGLFMGTPQYTAPEQAEGQPASFRSDLYALGVVLYEMLTGALPFDAETPMGIMMKQLRGQLRSPKEANPNVSEQLNAITVRLLDRDPEERYQDAVELIDDLERALRSLEDQETVVEQSPSNIEEEDASAVAITTVRVPDLTGQDAFQASDALANIGLRLGTQREVPSEEVVEGEIVRQIPEAGTEVETGSLVSVAISSGPEKRSTAAVAGLSPESEQGKPSAPSTELTRKTVDREEVEHRNRLDELYAQARRSHGDQEWRAVVDTFTQLHAVDPAYPDPEELLVSAHEALVDLELEEEERQYRLDELYAQARRSHRAQNWRAVVDAFDQIHAMNSACPDPEGLLVSAREALTTQELTRRVATAYEQGLRHMSAKNWPQALQSFEEVQRLKPEYRKTEALLSQVRRKLAVHTRQPPVTTTITVSNTDAIQLLRTLEGHKKGLSNVMFSPDGQLLVAGSGDQTVRLWRVGDGTLLRTLEGHTDSVREVAFSPDGCLLASGSFDGRVRLWEVEDGTLLRMLKGGRVFSVAFSPNGRLLASSSSHPLVRLWRVEDGSLLNTLKGHTDSVYSVAFSPDGQLLASAAGDRTSQLWRVEDGVLVHTLKGHTDSANSVAFSPDGQLLATGGRDQKIRLWRVEDGALLRTLEGHTSSVSSVAFSPDGKVLASGAYDKTVWLWSVEDGTLLHTLKGHTSSVMSVTFSPDGQLLASGAGDRMVRLWGIA